MLTRILKVQLRQPLLESNLSTSALSKMVGVSVQTLNKMMDDDWDYVARDAIERVADYFKLDASNVFALIPVEFWKQIEETKQYTFLRGSHDESGTEDHWTIPRADSDATAEIIRFVRHFDGSDAYADHQRDTEELIERAKNENCIVIGGPRTNAATEILLSRFFDAEPFSNDPDIRSRMPFGFCLPDSSSLKKQITLARCAKRATKGGRVLGITVNGVHVEADVTHTRDYVLTSSPIAGKDCGLVFVANRPFKTNKDVKLIVLAGFGGIGTLGAAKALIRDFRYLEPVGGEDCVYGVVQCWFNKSAGSPLKKLKRFRWVVRHGGSAPITKNMSKERGWQA
jgi:Cro/C1-type HTH DNA-binding domain